MAERAHLKLSLPDLLREKVNPILRGWGSYFCHGNSTEVFKRVDRYVYQRAVIFENRKRQRPGRSQRRGLTYGHLQDMGVYTLAGTVRLGTADARRA